jgi:aspartyl-tRNA(Asn)/glutamyl-tRNA(Gln) amidotransferase subunit B
MDRLMADYSLPRYDVEILTSDKALADYFEETVKLFPEGKTVSNWIMSELLRELKDAGHSISESPLRPAHLAELLTLVKDDIISGKIGKDIFPEVYKSGVSPKAFIEEKGLIQISDAIALTSLVESIIARYPKEVEDYRSGKDKLLGFFVGQVMKETKGKANPKLLNQLILDRLKAS